MRETWDCTDPRDAAFDRTFHVYDLDAVGEIKGGHWTIVYALAHGGDLDDTQVVDRWTTKDPRALTRTMVAVFAGQPVVLRDSAGRPDPNITRNLMNRLALYRRDGATELCFAVAYGDHLPAHPRSPVPPTDAMVERTRSILGDEGWKGHRWQSALVLDDLPVAPHDPLVFALVGVDARGRIDDALPRPNHHALDTAFARDLRSVLKAVVGHDGFAETVRTAEAKGLRLLYCWRPARRAAT